MFGIPRRHHFITKAYLEGFLRPGEEQLSLTRTGILSKSSTKASDGPRQVVKAGKRWFPTVQSPLTSSVRRSPCEQ
jgi:hypothetical protein